MTYALAQRPLSKVRGAKRQEQTSGITTKISAPYVDQDSRTRIDPRISSRL